MTCGITDLALNTVKPVQDSCAHREHAPIVKVAAPRCPRHIASFTPRSPQVPLRPLYASFLVLSTFLVVVVVVLFQINMTPSKRKKDEKVQVGHRNEISSR